MGEDNADYVRPQEGFDVVARGRNRALLRCPVKARCSAPLEWLPSSHGKITMPLTASVSSFSKTKGPDSDVYKVPACLTVQDSSGQALRVNPWYVRIYV